jgi:tRNA uridine 5-carboxymethylaminomethyl modification enzyme
MTSRAEYRLLLRQDNAEYRLAPIGHTIGLVSSERLADVEGRWQAVQAEVERLRSLTLPPSQDNARVLASFGLGSLTDGVNALQFLCRPEVTYRVIQTLAPPDRPLLPEEIEQVEIETKYAGYIGKQQRLVERVRRLENRPIPDSFDYPSVVGLRSEALQKLVRLRPATVGQATRIQGVNPADISLLLIHLERRA